jgi:hypothetical protein
MGSIRERAVVTADRRFHEKAADQPSLTDRIRLLGVE